MNYKNLDVILQQYIDRFDELNARDGNDEGYKRRAESWFKSQWDIDAIDFPRIRGTLTRDKIEWTSSLKKSTRILRNMSVARGNILKVGGVLFIT